MPAEVLFDVKFEPSIPPARTFRLALAVVLASLSALALGLASSPLSPVPPMMALSLPVAAPMFAAVTEPVPAAAAVAQPVQLHDDDERDIEALAGAVARRYRVSDEAIHDVVRASFEEARRNRLDPLLVVAVIAIESRFNPFAQSSMGAQGLMQVIPQYHPEKYDADGESMLDPRINIRVGARVLREYIARGGNESAGLRLYSGSSVETDTSYATKIATEKQRLQAAMRRVKPQAAPIA
jgi:soluble lytic murein transglycosylase-like protein